jgi:hypothetical protein
MDYELEKQKINDLYNDLTKDKVFPFISKFRLTILKTGLHKKFKSKYYGITMSKDKNLCYLMGYYYVPEDQVIVPTDLALNEKHINTIKKYENLGYRISTKPNLTFLDFDENSREWNIALKTQKNGNVNNEQISFVQS